MGRDGVQLGELEELALLAVLRLGSEAYGARIREELKDEAGRSVSIGTVYVTLMRSQEKGLLRSWMGEPSGVRGGKAKRFFALLPAGIRALERTREIREHLWKGVPARGRTHAR
jgi:DNA-binding PadR family transcriptional regulator